MAKKDPHASIQFYIGDRLKELMPIYSDSEAIGAWTKAWMYLWDNGPTRPEVLQKVVGSGWETIGFLFTETDGLFSLDWVEEKRAETAAFKARQKENGAKGGRPKSRKPKEKNPPVSKTKPKKTPRGEGEGDSEGECEGESISANDVRDMLKDRLDELNIASAREVAFDGGRIDVEVYTSSGSVLCGVECKNYQRDRTLDRDSRQAARYSRQYRNLMCVPSAARVEDAAMQISAACDGDFSGDLWLRVGGSDTGAWKPDPITATIWPAFEDFWDAYGKKIDRPKCIRAWGRLSQKDREAIMGHVPRYVAATPETKYRRNPLTYLNGENWNDDELTRTTAPDRPGLDRARREAERLAAMYADENSGDVTG